MSVVGDACDAQSSASNTPTNANNPIMNAGIIPVSNPYARFGVIESQLVNLTAQLQQLLNVQAQAKPLQQPGTQLPAPMVHPTANPVEVAVVPQKRRLEPTVLEKLSADVDLMKLESWQRRWNNFPRLGRVRETPDSPPSIGFRLFDATSCRSCSRYFTQQHSHT